MPVPNRLVKGLSQAGQMQSACQKKRRDGWVSPIRQCRLRKAREAPELRVFDLVCNREGRPLGGRLSSQASGGMQFRWCLDLRLLSSSAPTVLRMAIEYIRATLRFPDDSPPSNGHSLPHPHPTEEARRVGKTTPVLQLSGSRPARAACRAQQIHADSRPRRAPTSRRKSSHW
jgi:hypothetical protein